MFRIFLHSSYSYFLYLPSSFPNIRMYSRCKADETVTENCLWFTLIVEEESDIINVTVLTKNPT